jgi:chemotaxis protein CheX
MQPNEQDIIDLVSMIWATTLEMPIRARTSSDREAWPASPIESQVHITGSWRGAVVLHTSEALANRITQKMFGLGTDTLSVEDRQDAVGEITNITGGNIKGLLSDGDAQLSLPAVVQGTSYAVRVPGSRQISRLEFVSDGEPLVVTVLEAEMHGDAVTRGR